MKPLDEMSNDELADLVEYISNYQTAKRKISIDFKLAGPVLRGETELPDGFTFFSRCAANELLTGAGFMLAVYSQMIDRLQPPSTDLTDGELAVLESIAETGLIHREIYADGGDRAREQKRVVRKLYDVGLIENPTYDPHGMKLTPAGFRFFDGSPRTQSLTASPSP